ncbi:DUF4231 domain-containing protein [Saccharopolyspora rosea]|uniref:DUF4231 domain-containing protein n=1 Tax=Saccharopolyspora rosea TaxID=524884 RepID=A0ABW3FP81_9PSEU|nr:DUF4231 domain-containing protein [Saccharopolyspora rosea]
MTQPNGDLHGYREKVKEYELASNRLTRLRASQRAYWGMVIGGAVLALLLGYSVIVGLWQQKPLITQYVGLLVVVFLMALGGWLAWRNSPDIIEQNTTVRNLAHDKQTLAAKLPLDTPEGLRIYRESALDWIAHYRKRATRNRRINNAFQGIIIVASAVASTTTAITGEFPPMRWVATALSAIVTISAGLTAYFKFRERGHGLQTTADEIEKHYTAAQFKLDDFQNDADERQRLERFARYTERLKEEQRKRELQLEQSPEKAQDRN